MTAYLGILHAGAIAVPLNPSAPPGELERRSAPSHPGSRSRPEPPGPCSRPPAPRRCRRARPPRRGNAERRRFPGTTTTSRCCCSRRAPPAPRRPPCSRHGNLAANIDAGARPPRPAASAPTTSRSASLPFYHVFGLNVVLGVALAAGGHRRARRARSTRRESARARRTTRASPSSPVCRRCTRRGSARRDRAPPDTFATVRLAVSGAAPLPAAGRPPAFHERFGVVVHQGYGLTEAAPIVTTTALPDREPRPGSIGPPLPGRRGAARRRRRRRRARRRPGRALGPGPQRVPRLLARRRGDRPGAHARRVAAHRRRRGRRRAGDLRLVDRAKDLVIVSGFNVYPVEVEDVLRAEPEVRDAAVVGEPSPRTGEAVVAYVVPSPGRRSTWPRSVRRCARGARPATSARRASRSSTSSRARSPASSCAASCGSRRDRCTADPAALGDEEARRRSR